MPDPAAVGAVARRAGERIMAVYGQAHIGRTLKADKSPVTAADLAAHAEITVGLAALTPGVPIVSEEDLPSDAAALAAKAPYCWLVDPLDGTRDFLARSGDFTVNIALMSDGRPVLGCVFAPVRDELFLAVQRQGAERQMGQQGASSIKTRPVDPARFTALVSSWHRTDEKERIKRAFPDATIRRMGSSLKYVVIAAAEADIAVRFTPTSLWDTAAAQCILEEAGGALLTLDGKPLTYTHGALENPSFIAVGDRSMDVLGWLRKLG